MSGYSDETENHKTHIHTHTQFIIHVHKHTVLNDCQKQNSSTIKNCMDMNE